MDSDEIVLDLYPSISENWPEVPMAKPNQELETREPIAVIHVDWLFGDESRINKSGVGQEGQISYLS